MSPVPDQAQHAPSSRREDPLLVPVVVAVIGTVVANAVIDTIPTWVVWAVIGLAVVVYATERAIRSYRRQRQEREHLLEAVAQLQGRVADMEPMLTVVGRKTAELDKQVKRLREGPSPTEQKAIEELAKRKVALDARKLAEATLARYGGRGAAPWLAGGVERPPRGVREGQQPGHRQVRPDRRT